MGEMRSKRVTAAPKATSQNRGADAEPQLREEKLPAHIAQPRASSRSSHPGAAIRDLRRKRNLSLDQLAQLSGVSRSMISKVEREEATPSTTVLSRLAEALATTFAELLSPASMGEVVVLPAAKQPTMTDPETGFARRCIAPILPSRGLDWVRNTLPPGQSTGGFMPHRHGVEEYIYVLSGALRAVLGEESHVLEAGDALYFQAHISHAFENISDENCDYLLIIDSRASHPRA